MTFVEVVRGGLVESRHAVHVAVADASGRLVSSIGDADRVTYYRSAAKPFQTLPLIEDGVADGLGLTEDEIALCCGSHEGEDAHLAGARSILAKAGIDEGALRCGPHAPFSSAAAKALAAAGREPERIHNNCSGKHAGMLALAAAHGWPLEGYHQEHHPVQVRMREEVVRWTGVPDSAVATGIDGCGVTCFAVPLGAMAASFARFGAAAHAGAAPARVVRAMHERPFMVGGTGRCCTRVMERTGADAFVKLGAEGVYGGGLPARGLGFAIKVEDGGRRAVEAALIRVLEGLGVLSDRDVAALGRFAEPPVRNTRDDVVGVVRATFDLPAPEPT